MRDWAVAIKSGRGIGFLSLQPGVNDHSFVVGLWRMVPWCGLAIMEGKYRTHLASLVSQEMVGK